ncbi:hypothetical protein BM536_008345 [Streptomyces phaeoluteigriseus]|uniref:Uncharacterized protein n=1 Tax=Streptomyces phaeoluteigriseus TaxID=114686 RepID=A0A1V6MV05_9ACTN|nr:hypothetical protein BM536_008345 [Streptomyces phaeoluteigriseus]
MRPRAGLRHADLPGGLSSPALFTPHEQECSPPAEPPGAGGEHGQDDGEGGQPAHHRPHADADADDDARRAQDGQRAARHTGQGGQAHERLRGAAGWGSAAGSAMAVFLGEVGEGNRAT